MSRAQIFLIFAFAIIFTASADSACPPNEVYNDCGTACPATCKDPNPKVCTFQCVSGCQCVADYLRDDNGQCVPPKNCKNS